MTAVTPGDTEPPASPVPARVLRVDVWKAGHGDVEDQVAAEEPLEIRVNGAPAAVTMRTPGDDNELAAGFLLTEGLIAQADDLLAVQPVLDVAPGSRGNVVDAHCRPTRGAGMTPSGGPRQPRLVLSACGVCGQGSIESVRHHAEPLRDGARITTACLLSLSAALRSAQPIFSETGGLHAAGLFDGHGHLLVAREDIGRHNAVDKVIGHAVLRRWLPLAAYVLMVSGRTGFEIVLKAWMAGVPILASVSAPSSLAVQLAEEANLTLIGFLRGGNFTIYSGRQRLEA